MKAGVCLINPKFIHNVGHAVRAASCFGADSVSFTGMRAWETMGTRLPREERMKAYEKTQWWHDESIRPLDHPNFKDRTPIGVELVPGAEVLDDYFAHPEDAVYVFGPEDGGLPKGIRHACHRFVTIPTFHCTNLAAAVYLMLFHRTQYLHRELGVALPKLDEPRGEGWYVSSAIEGLEDS